MEVKVPVRMGMISDGEGEEGLGRKKEEDMVPIEYKKSMTGEGRK